VINTSASLIINIDKYGHQEWIDVRYENIIGCAEYPRATIEIQTK
jgi:hypothetical protein